MIHALNRINYRNGFLVNDRFMGGVDGDSPEGGYLGYVLDVTEGTTAASWRCPTLEEALACVNAYTADWEFESTKSCGEGECSKNEDGTCAIGGCGKKPENG